MIAALMLCGGFPLISTGQPTNMELFQGIVAECLQPVADSLDSVVIDPDPRMAYSDAILLSSLREAGVGVYRPDSTRTSGHARLRIRVDKAQVRYERRGGGIERTAEATVRYELALENGSVADGASCVRSRTDLIDRSDIARVENDLFPETKAAAPRGKWTRRFLEPAVITAATAVGVYLLFSLRSKKADS